MAATKSQIAAGFAIIHKAERFGTGGGGGEGVGKLWTGRRANTAGESIFGKAEPGQGQLGAAGGCDGMGAAAAADVLSYIFMRPRCRREWLLRSRSHGAPASLGPYFHITL